VQIYKSEYRNFIRFEYITPKPVKTDISNTWDFEGQMSLKIEGTITPSGTSAAGEPNEMSKIVNEAIVDYVKLNEYELKYSTYIYLAMSGVALGLITGGAGDVALVAGGSVSGMAAIANK
jgi:hypothetical protein